MLPTRAKRDADKSTMTAESPSSPAPATAVSSSPKTATKRGMEETGSIKSPPKKRARKSVGDDDTQQVTSLSASTRLPLADADVFYLPDFVDGKTAKTWYDELLDLPDWYRPTLRVYGKDVTQSRKIAAFATDPSLEVKYSGHPVKMNYQYPPLLRKIQDMVEKKLGTSFNHCMLNLYEDGSVYIGNHRDNKENRVIASLSLGAVRTFILTHTSPPPSASSSSSTAPNTALSASSSSSPALPATDTSPSLQYSSTLPLPSGSLLVMQGQTQEKWKHQIPKEWGRKEEDKVREGRISLTFRQLLF